MPDPRNEPTRMGCSPADHVFDLISEGLLCWRDSRYRMNRAAIRLLGGDPERAEAVLTGQASARLIDRPGGISTGATLIQACERLTAESDVSVVGLERPDQQLRWLRLRRCPPGDGCDQIVLITDVSVEVESSRRLAAEQARSAAWRRLAQGVLEEGIDSVIYAERVLEESRGLLGGRSGMFLHSDSGFLRVDAAGGGWSDLAGAEVDAGTLEDRSPPGLVAAVRRQPIPDATLGPLISATSPVGDDSEVTVVLELADNAPMWSAALLSEFLEELAVTLAHRRVLDRIEATTRRDPLTGLVGFADFHARAAQEAERARRRGKPLAIVVFDLDRMGALNRDHGAEVADRTMKAAADRLERVVNGSGAGGRNVMARLGEDTFAWLLVDADAILAETTAELGRMQIVAAPYPGVGRLTVSAGICDFDEDRGDVDQVLQYAAGALYWAKTHGRNQVCRYRPDVVNELSLSDKVIRLERMVSANGLRALAKAIDLKDPQTREHSVRVARLADQIASELGWDDERRVLLHDTCLVHDVGKIAVPDAILFKPGPLTESERELVEQHASVGARLCSEFLTPEQAAWVRSHHERWDGAGYPDRLSGDLIPEGARVLFVADAIEAMTSRRPYSEGRWLIDALAEVARQAGHQFDPAVVDAVAAVARRNELSWLGEFGPMGALSG